MPKHPFAPILLLCALAVPPVAGAQLVTPKTVPVLQSEQFAVYPASRPGMGGVSIALDDTLADPFVNPAKSARVAGTVLFGAPIFHGASRGGGGRTLSLGGVGAGEVWSFAAVAALQQLDRAGPVWNRPTSERTATNRYLSGSLARRLGRQTALGFSATRVELGAVDGVDLLYAGSDRIEQDGSLTDLRLGLTRDWGERTLEVVLLHNRTDLTHDVHFPRLQRWDFGTGAPTIEPERSEHNVDRTHIWGAHAEYSRPLGAAGARIGWVATANRLDHPKIPNYVIMNIPRDPGTTWSFNTGMGVSRETGPVTWGADVVYEPIWSETWADAAGDTTTASGAVIAAGGRTVENDFRFSNARLRLGVARRSAPDESGASGSGWEIGLDVYSIAYRLEQTNHVLETERSQKESWMEWTPSFAYHWRGQHLGVTYALRATCGAGGCELPIGGFDDAESAPATGGVIAAPSGPLFFDGGSSWSHRVMVSVPIGG